MRLYLFPQNFVEFTGQIFGRWRILCVTKNLKQQKLRPINMAFPEISLQYNLKIIFNYSIINIQLLTRITMFFLISYPPPLFTQSRRDRDLKSCQLITFDNSHLLTKVHFLLKSGFQVIIFFILLEVGYFVTIVVSFVYKWARQLFLGHYKLISDWFIFSEYFSNW